MHHLSILLLAGFAAGPVLGQNLSLEEALRLGETQSPGLAAQRSAVSASAQQVGRAGELPDPTLRWGIENLPVSGQDRFRYDRDFMTMRSVGVMQQVPNAAKREARNLRAERLQDVEAATLEARRVTLARETAVAWLELHYAERGRASLERLVSQFQLQLDALPAGVTAGRQTAADTFMLRGALELARDRIIEQDRVIARARIALVALIGGEAHRPLAAAPDMRRFAHPRDQLLANLAAHPDLRLQAEREALARSEVDLARSASKSDWAVEVGYGHRRPAFDSMLSVMVSIDLPWQKERRQDRDIASRLAEVDQARALQENVRRTREAEVRGWLADFDAASLRIERYERTHLALARDRSAAALASYRGGRGDLAAVLESERAMTDAELGLNQVLAERAKAWANLNYLYPAGAGR